MVMEARDKGFWSSALERWIGSDEVTPITGVSCTPSKLPGDPRDADDWFQTQNGNRFWLNNPRMIDVDLDDIFYALAGMPRFGCMGNRRDGVFSYTVGEHSFLIAWYARHIEKRSRDEVKHALLHDAAEAYTQDVKRPIKNACPEIRKALKPVERLVANVFDVPVEKPQWLVDLDTRIIADEKPVVFSGAPKDGTLWGHEARGVQPLGVPIRMLDPVECERLLWEMWRWCNGEDVEAKV